ncbi:alpha-N-acetylgalactosaminidase-like isoform X2 [Danaus plexippus]|uniref:alpha-N-acetylgalactosaminidase-like isoform X2 n=1 Tax=Danaus plexippus TaxID=13037 RepID=UPI002AB01A80|nr:alpha-N-acetylgalactosaminidase-like isoform X2 [Danaus plexippus]
MFLCLFLFIVYLCGVNLLNNGLAQKPPMGWMSWGYYMCGVDCKRNPHKCLNEELILSVVDSFYDEGYQEAGYEYIIIDDCWSERIRDKNGRLVPDRTRFPRGMKFIADYIHARGLKFGLYTNVADTTCMGYPGSRDHFAIDAKQFAQWEIDYLKVDGCFVSEEYLNIAYIKLGAHLNATGRPILYSCSWPYYIEFIHHKTPDYKSVAEYCNMWRNYHDVATSWEAVKAIITHYQGVYNDINGYHGPGHWNDPDMLGSITLWVKPHLPRKGDRYHSISFALVNLHNKEHAASFTPGHYGMNSTDVYVVMDVFSKVFLKNITVKDVIHIKVPPEDVVMYTLFPL